MRSPAAIVLAAGCLLPALAPAADFRVVVHPSHASAALSVADLSQIFLKARDRWDDGSPAEPVDLGGASPVREAFSQAVHGRSAEAVQSFWQKQIFAGRGVPPPELKSDAEVIAFVGSHPGGVGYVSAGASLAGVKELNLRGASGGSSTPPERSTYVAPVIPPLAKRAGVGGAVVLQIVVSPSGEVTEVTVIKSLPYGLTDEAIKAVRQWKFKPATRDGKAVEAAINVTVNFNL